MEYDFSKIEYVKAVKLSGFKTDVQVQITIKLKEAIDVQNLQVKLVSNPKGFNQIDKRWVDKYVEIWNIPVNISYILKDIQAKSNQIFLLQRIKEECLPMNSL